MECQAFKRFVKGSHKDANAMNYERQYQTLIHSAQTRTLPVEYTERHHILPVSRGGTNEAINLILLTGREHFLAHWLLWKWHRDKETAAAFWWMSQRSSNHSGRKRTTSRQFASARQTASEAKRGVNNPMFGLGTAHPNYKRVGKNNPNYGLVPWENAYVRTNPAVAHLWSQRDKLCQLWNDMGSPHWYAFGKAAIDVIESPHSFTPHTFKNMVSWFAKQPQGY